MANTAAPKHRDSKLTVAPPLAEQAYRALRDEITSGSLKPGQRLTERSLAEYLGVSPTPVREALRRLEQERLIDRGDTRTITVADPSADRLYELTVVEVALRGAAARLAAERATEAELEEIVRACDEAEQHSVGRSSKRPDKTAVLRSTRHLHELVDAASHSRTLIDMIATATAFDWPFRLKWTEDIHQVPDSAAERHAQHRLVAEALVARDGDTAERLMRHHVSMATAAFLAVAELTDAT
jgi:DNA-binding GntR family transcriptional regulator